MRLRGAEGGEDEMRKRSSDPEESLRKKMSQGSQT